MIRKLRIQFICIVMAVATLMVGGILGVVIHFTSVNLKTESISMMRTIALSPIQKFNPGQLGGEVRLPYFSVQISSRGELITSSSGYFDLSDQERVQQIINAALTSDQEIGDLRAFDLRYLKVSAPTGLTIIFADTSSESRTIQNLFYTCLLIFFIAISIFLGLSILLSHWVIKPVAAAWDQQRQFVADASHELKTPLSVIMANAELLQGDTVPPEDQLRFSDNILTMTYQMRSLVDSLLEMARVDNNASRMQFAALDLSQLVQDAVLSVQLLYEEKCLGLQCTVAEDIYIRGSEQHLYQVLDVLLDNALKYSTPNGLVQVRLCKSGKNCLLCVTNPGNSLSKEDLRNIFKRFYRGDQARAVNGSYGLGLSIADSIVSLHKGKIWATSEGGQNCFHVQFPLLPHCDHL